MTAGPGDRARDAGMAQALEPAHSRSWADDAFDWLYEQPYGRRFTSEDLVGAIGLPSGMPGTNINNAVGAVISGFARRGLIAFTGERVRSRRVSSHSAEVKVWTIL